MHSYGLDDDSDEEIIQIDDTQEAPPTQSLDGDEDMTIEQVDDDDDDEDDYLVENTFNFDKPSSNNFPATIGLQPQRVQVMQTSFFHNDDDDEAATQPAKELPKLIQSNHTTHIKRESTSPPPERTFKPPVIRKFKHTNTIFTNDSIFEDQSLALGRSFRVGFNKLDQFTHISCTSPSVISFNSMSDSTDRQSIEKSLTLQLKYTNIDIDQDTDIPAASTNNSLRFKNFVHTFNVDDLSHEPVYWRLGSALFDEIDLRLPNHTTDTLRNRVMAVRRKEALSQWLQSTLSETVESELKQSHEQIINRIFTLLTGHQITRAANLATSNGDYKLATLITQSPGDAEFRHDLYTQIQKWKEYKADAQIDGSYRKVYALLAGITDNLDGNNSFDDADKAESINVSQNLDWLRCFGLRLWYATLDEQGISDAVDAYDSAHSDENGKYEPTASAPVADHHTKKSSSPDALYSLIKLFIDPAYTLEKALEPIGFTSSKQDWRLSWHVYTILSRVLRLRDFGRFAVEEADGVEGHSQKADTLTVSYASQVECAGLYAWSVFVLLHVELDDLRARAIKDSLARNVMRYTDTDEEFLLQKLQIPSAWLSEAKVSMYVELNHTNAPKATYAHYSGDRYKEYKLLLDAELYSEAHLVAVNALAPEAIIRDDLALLARLLEPFLVEVGVDGWSSGGKVRKS